MSQKPIHMDEVARREFLRWTSLAALALGLERVRYLEVLDGLGGAALAQAATSKTRKSVHLIAGSGGLANFTLAFPHPHVAKTANGNFSLHSPGQGVLAQGTDRPLYYVDGSPFQNAPRHQQITAFLCNQNQTHTTSPTSLVTAGNSLIAACAAVQTDTPALLPALVVNNVNVYGSATGAPSAASVPNPGDIVGLFDSAASKALLEASRNPTGGDNLLEVHTALLALNKASRSATARRAFDSSKTALSLLGKVLADRIRPTPQQLALYGFDSAVQPVRQMIQATAATLNAMGLGLTRMVAMPAFNDDPHGMFNGGDTRALNTARSIGRYFEGVLAHGGTIQDYDDPSKKLSDCLVITVTGDTMKEPFSRGNWPDGSPGGSSVMYVWGQQYLKKGWFGGFHDDTTPLGFNPSTGENIPFAGNQRMSAFASASAAVLYAIAAGDPRRIDSLARGVQYEGLVNRLTPQ